MASRTDIQQMSDLDTPIKSMTCPHCNSYLVPFVLDVMQCPSDWTVHEAEVHLHSDLHELQKVISHAPDMTLADAACPIKGCD